MQLIVIAAGGAIGSIMRYGISSGMHNWLGRSFPYGTLVVNVIGSLLIGFLFVVLNNNDQISPHWRSLLLVGFLGALTTFSTFSFETLQLLQKAEMLKVTINVLSNVLVCVAATWVGLTLAKNL